MGHALVLDALAFLVAVEEFGAAEDFVVARFEKIDGDSYETLRRSAKALSQTRPLGAVLLYRKMVLAVLAPSNSTHYPYAVRDIREASRLAAHVTDWREQDDHATFLADLRRQHARKPAFWKIASERGFDALHPFGVRPR